MKRPIFIRKPGAEVKQVLDLAKTDEQKDMVQCLLYRYGVRLVVHLRPEDTVRFLEELVAILDGKAPHPADSTYRPRPIIKGVKT